jgi:hypothetical protein
MLLGYERLCGDDRRAAPGQESYPVRAARHFFALVDDALARSGDGTSDLTTDDVAGSVAEAVDTFLSAFGNRAADEAASAGTTAG